MWHDSFICADAFFVYGREHSFCWNEPCCLICTIHSRLTYFPICTTTEWAGFDNSWCCSVLQLLQCVAVCRYSLVSSGQVQHSLGPRSFRAEYMHSREMCIHSLELCIYLRELYIYSRELYIHSRKLVIHSHELCIYSRKLCIHSRELYIHSNCTLIRVNWSFIRVNCAFIHVNCTFIHARECGGHMCTAYIYTLVTSFARMNTPDSFCVEMTQINTFTCHTHGWVMPHICALHICTCKFIHTNERTHICLFWNYTNGHIHMSHAQMSHVAHIHASCRIYEWVMSHIWMSHVAHMNESCRTCKWVMSHIWISHVAHMHESCRTYEWIMSHV